MPEHPTFRPATEGDAAELALVLREADRVEIKLGGHASAYEGLVQSLRASDNPLAIVSPHGDVLALFGVSPWVEGFMASPWMMGSTELPRYRHRLMRECLPVVEAMNTRFPVLHNDVWEGNTVHINWLRRLGFEVSTTSTKRPGFLPFWRVNNVRSSNPGHRGDSQCGIQCDGYPAAEGYR